MYAKLTLMNVSATNFLTAELVDICFMIPLQRKQSTKPMKVITFLIVYTCLFLLVLCHLLLVY